MKQVVRLAIAALFLVPMGACNASSSETAEATELTRGQKDTIISRLPIRGSRGVGRALEAVETSQVRALEHDSIG